MAEAVTKDEVIPPVAEVAPPSSSPQPGAEPAEVVPPPAAADATAAGEHDPKPTDAEPVPEPSLLEQFDAKKAEKPADAAPPAEAKPDDQPKPEEKPADAPAEPDAELEKPADGDPEPDKPALETIDYFEDIKLPETIKLDDAERTKVAGLFDQMRADPKAGAQAMVDYFNTAMTEGLAAQSKDLVQRQWDAFNETRQGWKDQVMADPILGGAKHDTAMMAIAEARDAFVSTAAPGSDKFQADLAEFNDFLKVTGAGDHPVFLRFLHNARRFVREASPPPPEAKPTRDGGRQPRTSRGLQYDNPSSHPDR
jgi:hypothetical protein